MNKWFSLLSTKQRVEMFVTFLIIAIIVAVGVLVNSPKEQMSSKTFTTDMSINKIAPEIGVTGKGLARELNLPLGTPKKKPLNKSGISQQQLDHAVAHILSHHSTTLKYYVFAAIVIFGLVYLTRLGRPDNSNISERKLWYPRLPYIVCLIAAVLVCGFVLGKSPNPMEGIVKVFKSMVGLYPSVTGKIIAFAFLLMPY